VSGLTPRYCDAWRIFMTSRESAIVSEPFSQPLRALQLAATGLSWEELLVQNAFE
jgi:hypothetical protein